MFSRHVAACMRLLAVVVALLGGGANATTPDAERRDPTRPPVAPMQQALAQQAVAQSTDSKLVVTSILTGSTRRIAVINGRVRRVGDRVGAMTVAGIEPRRVVLHSPGEGRIVLSIAKRTMQKDFR